MTTNSIRTFARTLTLTAATLFGSIGLAHAAEPPSTADELRFDAANTLEGQININTASAAELELLPGIGPSTAAKIIDYRKEHKFEQRNHIMRIKGVGQKTFAKIKDYLVVEGETTLKIVK